MALYGRVLTALSSFIDIFCFALPNKDIDAMIASTAPAVLMVPMEEVLHLPAQLPSTPAKVSVLLVDVLEGIYD